MTRSTESGRIMLIRKEFAEDGVLIELYWNVNDAYDNEYLGYANVLIELYWNVNYLRRQVNKHDQEVLIELYWNVN